MRTLVVMAAAVVGGLAAAPVQAMPLGALADDGPGVTLVAQGCGPGWFRNPWGRCVPMGGAPVYRPYAYAPGPYYGPRPYYAPRPMYGGACWWRNGVRVCR